MRKQLPILTAIAIAATASAGTPGTGIPELREQMPQAASSMSFNRNEAFKANALSSTLQQSIIKNGTAIKAQKKGDAKDSDEMITEAPKGESVYFERKAWGYYAYGDNIKEYTTEGYASEVVFGDDGYVYFKEPFSQAYCGSYFKGKLEDGVITVSLPQVVYQETDYDDASIVYNYELKRLTPSYNDKGEIEDYVISDNQEYKMTYKDGVILPVDDDEDILGLTYQGKWMYYGEHYLSFAPLAEEVTEAPKTESVEYAMLYNGGLGKLIKLAKDGDQLYINGLSAAFPDSWVKGTIEGNQVTFKPQYLGVYADYFFYFLPGYNDPIYYEGFGWYDNYKIDDTFVLTYDEATDSYSAPEDKMIIINAGKEEIYYLEAYKAITIKKQNDVTVAKPATPSVNNYAFYETNGYGRIKFDIPQTTTTGEVLDAEKLYYNVFFDGELFTFYPDEYENLPEELTDIPYTYSDNWDFFYSGVLHTIYFYSQGLETIGAQTLYKSSNGNTYYSDKITYDIESGETTVTPADEQTDVAANLATNEVVKAEYFDLSGRRVINPSNGMYIKRLTLANGEVKTTKAVIK